MPIRCAVHVYPGWLDSAQTPLGDVVRALDSAPAPWPTLVIVGEEDPLIRSDSRAAIAAHLGVPGGHQLISVESVAHGFLAPHRQTYDAEAAQMAWTMALHWFDEAPSE